MIVIYCFYPGDQELALKNAQWMTELGGCKGHELLACWDPRCDSALVDQIREELSKSFDKLYKCTADAEIDGWPEGANYFFRLTTTWLQSQPDKWPCFFWLEPDAIPLSPGWLDKLEAEYKRAGKPFLGDRVEVEDIPLHMSGVGIYQNPIYLNAGEAYRAYDVAWDMAAKDQIVPNAHFTNLIEHAWKHPTFHMEHELKTQINPETILFHSSKDGSLIDLLRGRKQSGTEANAPASSGSVLPITKEPEIQPGSPSSQTFDIFIRTYPGDYYWLDYCLKSIEKFVSGFRKIWIISNSIAPPIALPENAEWKVMNDETQDGYLAQQITKLYADHITSHQPDYILHVDSDVIFTRPTTPGNFFAGDKPIWYYTPYDVIQTPWQPVTEKFMAGMTIPYEFMRRLPMMIPRQLYPKLREFCHHLHGVPMCDYVKMQPQRAFSEFNVMGAYAYFHHNDRFEWINTATTVIPEPCARQFHSWGGLTPDIQNEIEQILSGMGEKLLKDAPPVPSQIKILPELDVWVLNGDQISQWVEQEGRLDHDQNLLPDILKHIGPGDTVVDAGAFIGDHTVAYSKAVGSMGVVYAFEPNPYAFKCLEYNTRDLKNVSRFPYGLSDHFEVVPLSGNNGNWGGAYVGEHMKIGDIQLKALETEIPWVVNFMKIDVEGYELKVLRGAGNLINRCKPKMVIEINSGALSRQKTTPEDIFTWLDQHGYQWSIMQQNCYLESPLYDIICLPNTVSPEKSQVASAATSPVAFNYGEMIAAIQVIKQYASQSTNNRLKAMSNLRYAGLTSGKKHKKKK